jgi:hypothetical protein
VAPGPRGYYVQTAVWEALSTKDQHLMVARARQRTLGPDWYLARRSSALGLGIPLIGAPPEVPQLVRHPPRKGASAHNRHERFATLPPHDTGVLANGQHCTAPARTVNDLTRSEPFRNGLVAADAALANGLDRRWLVEVSQRCAGWPGGLGGVRVAKHADGLSESPLESLSRAVIIERGLELPELQVEVWVGSTRLARVDKLWRGSNLVGEDDGKLKYTDTEVRQTAATIIAEKEREEALEAVGLEVARWGWDQAFSDPDELERRIRRGLKRGALNELDPRVRFVTTTVKQSLRRSS